MIGLFQSTLTAWAADDQIFKLQTKVMGTQTEIQICGVAPEIARPAIEEAFTEMRRLEALMHPDLKESDIYQLNAAAGRQPIKLHPEVFSIIKLAQEIARQSDGAFDVTFAGAGQLWDFHNPDAPIPSDQRIAEAVKVVNYRLLVLDHERQTAFLSKPGMRVGLGGVAKGYAADAALQVLKKHGLTDAIVHLGGEMLISGTKAGQPWTIGIQHPRKDSGQLYAVLHLMGTTTASTSGDYERYFFRSGVRYHHILNPHNGKPARLCQSVTILAPTGMLADILATTVFVLGPAKGLDFLHRYYPNCEALILDAQGREHLSESFASHAKIQRVNQ